MLYLESEFIGELIPEIELPEIEIPEVPIFGPFTDVIMKFLPLIEATVKSMIETTKKDMEVFEMIDIVYNNFHSVDSLPNILGIHRCIINNKYKSSKSRNINLGGRVLPILKAMVKTGSDLIKRHACKTCGGPPTLTDIINIIVDNMKPEIRMYEIEKSNKKAFKRSGPIYIYVNRYVIFMYFYLRFVNFLHINKKNMDYDKFWIVLNKAKKQMKPLFFFFESICYAERYCKLKILSFFGVWTWDRPLKLDLQPLDSCT